MLCAAIIAEYNPFHHGHAWQIARTRALGATHIAVIMSGNYVQRGEPALWEKRVRARAALACGADLVAELPLPYAVAGAQRFARGAVALCDALGVVDRLSFGSECGAIQPLEEAADALEDPRTLACMRELMQQGITFARARMEAVAGLHGEQTARVLRGSNNILALEYLAALRARGSAIRPLVLPRQGAGHDEVLSGGPFASASALRELAVVQGTAALAPYVPAQALALYAAAPRADPGLLELPLLSKLRGMSPADFRGLPEVSEGLENVLYKASRRAAGLQELYTLAKSRRYTHARIRRLALAAFLSIPDALSAGEPPYLRILGMNERGAELLRAGRLALPTGSALKRLEKAGERAAQLCHIEAAAADQYALLQNPRGPCGEEYRAGIIRA